MRIFIAYKIDEKTRSNIEMIQEQLKVIYQQGRFKPSKNMHMTLKFIGEVSVEQYELLISKIDEVINEYSVLNIELNQLGFFGSSTKNHTLWIGCQKQPAMTDLSEVLSRCAFLVGISVNSTPFVPHITLAQHGMLLNDLPEIEHLNVCLDQVCIFLSSRIEGELVYQPLKCWKLK